MLITIFKGQLNELVESIGGFRGGGFRGGGYRGSSGARSSYRSGLRSVASRYTSSNGYRSANRFSYNPATRQYRYGSYSGNRFGSSIRSKVLYGICVVIEIDVLSFLLKLGTTYWPLAFIYLGSPYRSVYHRPYRNGREKVNGDTKISDRYTKKGKYSVNRIYV